MDAAYAKAMAAGATSMVEPKDPDVFEARGLKVRIAFVKGPAGEVFEFFQCADL